MELGIAKDLEQIKVEVRQAVVGYCDITEFTTWIRLSAKSNRDITDFLKRMKWIFRKFRLATGYYQIGIGDGIIAILDSVPDKAPIGVLKFVVSIFELSKELSTIADQQNHPRPGQSRIRITAGEVYRIEEPPPSLYPFDFFGEPMNLGHALLHLRRELPALITKSALDFMTSEEQSQIIIKTVEVMGRLPRGVEPKDIQGLCAFWKNPNPKKENDQ